MTVKELIEKLQEFNPSARVIVDGYEGGYNDFHQLTEIKIIVKANSSKWYYGKHMKYEENNKHHEALVKKDNLQVEDVIYIC